MLEAYKTRPGFLFGSFLYRSDLFIPELLKERWVSHYGLGDSIETKNNPLFAYYTKEMGDESLLKRFFITSENPLTRDHLLSSKLLTLDWEREWAVDGKRMVNIDVGFIALENFLLATTKPYSHRVFLGSDIYADLTFQFQSGTYRSLPWTYPDYQDDQKIDFLVKARAQILKLA